MHSITFTISAVVVNVVVFIPAYLLTGILVSLLQQAWIKVMTTKGVHCEPLAFTVLGYAIAWPFIVMMQITIKLLKVDITGLPHISWDRGAPRGGYKVDKEVTESLKGLKVGDKVRLSYIPSSFVNYVNPEFQEAEGVIGRSYSKMGLKQLSLISPDGKTGYFLNESGNLLRKLTAPVVKLS